MPWRLGSRKFPFKAAPSTNKVDIGNGVPTACVAWNIRMSSLISKSCKPPAGSCM